MVPFRLGLGGMTAQEPASDSEELGATPVLQVSFPALSLGAGGRERPGDGQA